MSSTFLLQIVGPAESKEFTVRQIDVSSVLGGFFIGPESAPLASLLGKKSMLHLVLADNAETTLTIEAGFLTIDEKGNVSILILDPAVFDYEFDS